MHRRDSEFHCQTGNPTKAPYESELLHHYALAEFPSAADIDGLVRTAAGGANGPERILKAISELKGLLNFGLARRILERAHRQYRGNTKITQQLALCTYKDEELHAITRFDKALGYLKSIGLGDPGNGDSETDRLGGAVYKRKWEFGGQIEDLYQALAHYRAACAKDPVDDMGYGAVNAAYILDILASRARRAERLAGLESGAAERLAAEAQALRADVIELLESLAKQARPDSKSGETYEKSDWFALTLAEAYFGSDRFEEAGAWLAKAREAEPKEWECETAVRQLVGIARLKQIELPADLGKPDEWAPPWQAVRSFLAEETASALSCYRGKIGLALSGGGFRASFFHIGVLARLAEIDALRHVDVLSTVSGGSIVGAHYYLEVQRLLKEKADGDIEPSCYIELVKRVEDRFFRGVERNIRMRVLNSLVDNVRMLFSKGRSRTHRLGELYERELYAEIEEEPKRSKPRYMCDLLVCPQGLRKGERFNPKQSNWRRVAKVPILLLNCATLNSGHNWRFTATWMGEPPTPYSGEIDKNERYRRLYYRQAKEAEHQHFRLGHAVAASSCVPGLFEPLAIRGLYQGDRVVQLVDGGVHDNQGVHGLLDEGCKLIICSDASGQMTDQPAPSNSIVGAPLRSNSILMDRVREAQFDDLKARVDSGALNGLLYLHLTKGLESAPVDWIDSNDPKPPASLPKETPYDIPLEMQKRLSEIRTDLDSFTEVEAYSLMYSGYRMANDTVERLQQDHENAGLPGTWGDFEVHAPTAADWKFMEIEDFMKGGPHHNAECWKDILCQLSVAKSLLFKVFARSCLLQAALVIFGVLATAVVGWLVARYWDSPVLDADQVTIGGLILLVIPIVAGLVLPLWNWLIPQKALRGLLLRFSLATFGCAISNLQIYAFDPIYRKLGRLERLKRIVR